MELHLRHRSDRGPGGSMWPVPAARAPQKSGGSVLAHALFLPPRRVELSEGRLLRHPVPAAVILLPCGPYPVHNGNTVSEVMP